MYVPVGIEEPQSAALPPLTVRETIHLSSIFCFFWFVANWSGNAALGFTSVASATILSSMSGACVPPAQCFAKRPCGAEFAASACGMWVQASSRSALDAFLASRR